MAKIELEEWLWISRGPTENFSRRAAHGVEPICKVLSFAPSTYHAHVAKRRDPTRLSARAQQDAVLKIEVRRVFDQNFLAAAQARRLRYCPLHGVATNADHGLARSYRGKPVKTTIRDKAAPCPLDHVNRQFKASKPNVLWLSDFTYVATWTGFIYVACEGLRLPIHALEQHGDCVLDDCFR